MVFFSGMYIEISVDDRARSILCMNQSISTNMDNIDK